MTRGAKEGLLVAHMGVSDFEIMQVAWHDEGQSVRKNRLEIHYCVVSA